MADYQTFPTAQPLDTVPAYSIDPAQLAAIQQWAANPTMTPVTAGIPSTVAAPLFNAAGGLNILSDPGPAYDPSQVYRFKTGGTGASGDVYTPVVYQPGQNYTLTDSSGKTIGTASSADQLQQLMQQANSRGSWNLYRGAVQPGAELAQQTNSGSFGSMIVPMAAIALGGLGLSELLPAAAAGGAGGAAGAAGAGAAGATGGSLGAATGLGAAGGLGTTGAALSGGLGSLAAASAPLITVTGAAGGLGAGTLAGLGAGALGGGLAATGALGGGSTGTTGATAANTAVDPNEIVVTGAPTTSGITGSQIAGLGGLTGVGSIPAATGSTASNPPSTPDNTTVDQNPINVSHAPIKDALNWNDLYGQAITSGLTGQGIADAVNAATQPATQKTWQQKLADYLKYAGYGAEVLGGLFGGSNNSAGTIPAGLGTLNPIFSKQLPSANMPGAGNMSPRVMPQQDWTKYAFHPEQSFFSNVPQNPAGYARGGDVHGGMPAPRTEFAVHGDGDGRDDAIPAKLSDGEYVMDAETVSMLGNGSNKAGADKLDQFRVNLRKHKGKQLTKGKMSNNAKQPEQYLSGGRA